MNITTTKNNFIKKDSGEYEINGKVVRNSAIARKILEKGKRDVWLFDIKPDRNNPQRTVYLFENTEKFQEIFQDVLKETRATVTTKSKKEIEDLKQQIEEIKKLVVKE